MTGEIEDVVDIVAPQIGVTRRLATLGVYAVIAIVAAVAIGWMVWKLFFAERAAQAEHDRVEAHGQALVGGAQGNAGAAAANTVAGAGARETIIRERTNNNYVEITKQPGASDPVSDAVDAAGRRAICLRASAVGLPECQRLQEADTE